MQQEIERARDAQRQLEGVHPARRLPPSHQTVYRGTQAAPFEDREGRDAETVQPEGVAVEGAANTAIPTQPTRSFSLRAPITGTALRQAFILSDILGPPAALRRPDER